MQVFIIYNSSGLYIYLQILRCKVAVVVVLQVLPAGPDSLEDFQCPQGKCDLSAVKGCFKKHAMAIYKTNVTLSIQKSNIHYS